MHPILNSIKSSIPNAITCMNALSGTVAIIFAFHYNELYGSLHGYEMSYIFIAAAAVFDFFDGFCARLLHAQSEIGKELDSLSDLVSFGVAPALLMFNTMQNLGTGSWLSYATLLIVAFGALRLAKFNTDSRQTTYFIGLPIPANAIFWIGMCGWIHRYHYINEWMLAVIILMVSWLMVSEIKMFSLKFKSYKFSENVVRYILIIGTISFVVFYGISGLMWAILFYLMVSMACRSSIH